MSNVQAITLCELNIQVKTGIHELFPDTFWVIGEISEININHSGHCYLELIEKKAGSEQIIARAKATIWAFTFRILRPYFESTTKQRLTSGIKIMVQVSIEFHEVYGFSLNIKDIEPNFTIGDLSRNRQEIIQRLQNEGVFHLNKELEFPMVPQRVAVISSKTAAGYGDFADQLANNNFGYRFHIKLFQSSMQGDGAEQSIITALEQIFESIDKFDVIVIIRGGGAQADLDCFNSYWLCYHITQIPVPIITGIGHERDETITDLVAHTSLKTPTAVAEFLINHVAEFDECINDMNNRILNIASEQLQFWKDENERLTRNIVSLVKLRINSESQRILSLGTISQKALKGFFQKSHQKLNTVSIRIKSSTKHSLYRKRQNFVSTEKNLVLLMKNFLKNEHKRLEKLESSWHLLDPVIILKRGYTMTLRNGILVKSSKYLKEGDMIESQWSDGKVLSAVKKTPSSKRSD
jgi:exodeoxyribonuclease VII large subunit